MPRNPKKKALYEVMGKGFTKPSSDKMLEQLHPQPQKPVYGSASTGKAEKSTSLKWPTRPRIVQFNAGRVEFSLPYQVVVALFLSVVLLILVFFRLGQFYGHRTKEPPAAKTSLSSGQLPAVANRSQIPAQQGGPSKTAAAVRTATPGPSAAAKANNRIVIQTYQFKNHLEPVKDYFAGFGIETEIIQIDNWWYLVTKDKYENPDKPGTDGYRVKERIIQLGSGYKAPAGYETFGSKPFYDAYGKKFED